MLPQEFRNLLGGTPRVRFNFEDGYLGTADAAREFMLRQIKGFATLLEPLAERWHGVHVAILRLQLV